MLLKSSLKVSVWNASAQKVANMKFLTILVFTIVLCFLSDAEGQTLQPVLPVQVNAFDPDVGSTLDGWSVEKKPYSKNRIVFRQKGFRSARILTFSDPSLDAAITPSQFEGALKYALSLEGVSNVEILEQRAVKSQFSDAFRIEINAPDTIFIVWIISGDSAKGVIKASGISMISAQSANPGTSVEGFIATKDEYEHLGGIFAPLARYFGVQLTSLKPDPLGAGRISDNDAIDILEYRFDEWMTILVRRRIMAGIANQQTLGMSLNLGVNEGYGLDDPLFDPF